ncbi:flocculation protein FLO11-like [Quercus robur]|uniref:flocculation protein FLO11-like n=1 Tax=Quercus robur TaxID=38942 RepID=UPI002162DB20|nr:flocculation protein FLO11-like [Quercus robur]
MTSFEQELLGRRGFSLIPPDGLAYARKQGRSAILEWDEEGGGWYWHASDYPPSWEKKVKITNLSTPGKKGLAKPKSSTKGGEVVPLKSDLPPISRIALKGSPPSSARTRSSARPTASKPKSTAPRPSIGAPPSSRTRCSKRKTSPHPTPTTERRGVSVEAPIPSLKPVPMKGTHTEGVSEDTPISAETPIPQKGAIPPATQTEVASPSTPLVISTSNPFATLSQAVKDGSSLVVTPSSILSSANRGLDADLSSEGSEDVFEDPDDEPIIKKRIFESDEGESADSKTEFMETFKEPKVAADTWMPIATSLATSTTPVSAILAALASAILVSTTTTTPISATLIVPASAIPVSATVIAPVFAILTAPILMSPGPLPTVSSQFEVGSSSATISNPVSEAAAFFAQFDQPEVNDLDPADF